MVVSEIPDFKWLRFMDLPDLSYFPDKQVATIQKQIKDIGGPKLKKFKAKIEELSVKLETLATECAKLQVQVSQNTKKVFGSQLLGTSYSQLTLCDATGEKGGRCESNGLNKLTEGR